MHCICPVSVHTESVNYFLFLCHVNKPRNHNTVYYRAFQQEVNRNKADIALLCPHNLDDFVTDARSRCIQSGHGVRGPRTHRLTEVSQDGGCG